MLDRGGPRKHEEQMRKRWDYFEMKQPCRATWKSKSRDNHLSGVSSINCFSFSGVHLATAAETSATHVTILGWIVTSGNGSMLSVKRPIDDCVGGIASCRTVDMTLSFGFNRSFFGRSPERHHHL